VKQPPPSDQVLPYLEKLKEGKVKVTPNRRKVLGRFLEAEKPWTLSSLHRSLSQEEECDSSSVYRTLEALRTAGLLEEFRLPGERQTYYSLIKLQAPTPHKARSHAHADHHHHIVCQDCGTVSHLDICVPVGWMGKVENASGFRITEHHLEFKGICSSCR
jgi:Fur family transcriptional regulator, ferric uptake regulator